MSLIGLLASTENMVPEGRLHMRPFKFHLKEHWIYPQSLDNILSSAALNRDPTTTSNVNDLLKQSHKYVFHNNPQQLNLHAWCLGADNSQEHGFSVEVAERIAAPQRSSTRTIYKSKWALFEKWCRENSVDFYTPSVKQISDFFRYLYQDLHRRPSTIDGYRTVIVDTLGPTAHHIAHNTNLHRLFSSFHRDPPKVPEIYPSGTFLLSSTSSQKHPLSP